MHTCTKNISTKTTTINFTAICTKLHISHSSVPSPSPASPFALSLLPRLVEPVTKSPSNICQHHSPSIHRHQNVVAHKTHFYPYFKTACNLTTTPEAGFHSGFPQNVWNVFLLRAVLSLRPCWLYAVQCSWGNVAMRIIVNLITPATNPISFYRQHISSCSLGIQYSAASVIVFRFRIRCRITARRRAAVC